MKEEPSRALQASRPQSPGPGESRPVDHLQRAREACEHNAWHDAYEAYRLADAAAPLTESDLDGLALASYLLGRDDEFVALKERSHRAHVAVNRAECAARDAFWLAVMFLFRGDLAQSNAWIARGERLLCDRDCAECGYLAMQKVEVLLRGGSPSEAHAMAAGIVALGQRCGDADLVAAACHLQGRAAIAMGESARGLKLLDETMLAAVSGELSPIMTGLMYCSVIDACREAHEWSRAREWTAALSKWCDRQGGMVAFTDACLVHRAEILRLQGAWQDSLTESRRVCDRGEHARRPPPGAAFYEQGEVHRLRGDLALAEEAYRAANRRGFEPQPGLALLRLAQGRTDAAAAAIHRLAGAARACENRGRMLPAYFEIMLATGNLDEAQRVCEALDALRDEFGTVSVHAQAAQARGALCLHCDDANTAMQYLRESFALWESMPVPYEAARVRVMMAQCCELLGDADAAALERDAARAIFEQLGAKPDLERLTTSGSRVSIPGALTTRELEVIRLVAQGFTNKAIGKALGLSTRTIDRHVANILGKLDAPSRAAAIAMAATQRLL